MSAQTTVGGRIGASFATADVQGLAEFVTPNIDAINTFSGGIYINHKFDDLLGVTSGIHYRRKGFLMSQYVEVEVFDIPIPVGAKAETRVDYIEIPLLLNFSFNKGKQVQPYIEIGPTFSFAARAEIQPIAQALLEFNLPIINLDLSNDIYNRVEVAAMGGAGIKIPYGRGEFDLGVNYSYAFTELLNNPVLNINARNRVLGIHIGYAIRIGTQGKTIKP